jgi:hypothetical protein
VPTQPTYQGCSCSPNDHVSQKTLTPSEQVDRVDSLASLEALNLPSSRCAVEVAQQVELTDANLTDSSESSLPLTLRSLTMRLNAATALTAGSSAWLTSLLATSHCGECFFTRVLPLSALIGLSSWAMHRYETLRAVLYLRCKSAAELRKSDEGG